MTRRLKAALALFAGIGCVALAGGPAPGRADDKKDEKKASSLEGTYTVVSGEEDGKVTPEEKIKGSVVKFTADRIVGTDRDKKEFFAANYTLDTTQKPWTIKMKSTAPKEAEAAGLIKKEGDTVTLVYALPGAEVPKEFKTKERQHLFVLKPSDKAGEKK